MKVTKAEWELVMQCARKNDAPVGQLCRVAWWLQFNPRKFSYFLHAVKIGMAWRFAYRDVPRKLTKGQWPYTG